MQLLTEGIIKRFKKVGCQENVKDPVVVAKFFNPTGAGTWFATEYDPNTKTFFGYVSIFNDWNDEWGSFSLKELEDYIGKWDLGIERDMFFKEQRISEVKPEAVKFK